MPEKPYLSLIEPWHVEDLGQIADTPIFSLNKRRCTSRQDATRSGEFVYLHPDDWVNVAALTPAGDLVMIEQFRYGSASVTLELPGGVVDAGEDPLETARRELLEETGYAGDPPESLGSVLANPAMQDNRCHYALIRNARPVADQDPDEHEEIAVRTIPRNEIKRLVREGVVDHSLIVAALYKLELLED